MVFGPYSPSKSETHCWTFDTDGPTTDEPRRRFKYVVCNEAVVMERDYLTTVCPTTVSSTPLLLPSPGKDDPVFTPR